jgi:hypothetical protein
MTSASQASRGATRLGERGARDVGSHDVGRRDRIGRGASRTAPPVSALTIESLCRLVGRPSCV